MQSMTGFGRAEKRIGTSQFTIELKSVNHRYLDLRFRLPPMLGAYEFALADLVRGKFERGSFEVAVKQKVMSEGSTVTGATRFVVDESAAQSFLQSCDWMHYKHKTEKLPSIEAMTLTGKIFLPLEETPDPKELFGELKPAFEAALDALHQMRLAEGRRVKELLLDGLKELTRIGGELAKAAPEQPKRIRDRITQRISQWGLSGSVEPQRLEWEVAFYADRADITEEIDRLNMHVKEFTTTLEGKKPAGRKLDFLAQELFREVNTIAAKADALSITQLAVSGKSCIEKLREQVQNVE